MKTPEELLELIDTKYNEAKKEKLSRFDVRWGKWSALMNQSLRERMKDNPNDLRLRYVFIYWSLRSQLLELYYKSRLFGKTKKKGLIDELSLIREMILSGKGMESLSENDLFRYLLGKVGSK